MDNNPNQKCGDSASIGENQPHINTSNTVRAHAIHEALTPHEVSYPINRQVPKYQSVATLQGMIGSRIKITSAKTLSERPVQKTPKLVEPWLNQSGVAALTGSSDIGKSKLATNLGFAIATGQTEFMGFKLNTEHKAVLYVSTEDNENDLMETLAKIRGKDKAVPEGFYFMVDVQEGSNLPNALEKFLVQQPVDLIVVDAMADVAGHINPNDLIAVRNALTPYKLIANRFNCLILYIHHTVKNADRQIASKRQVNGSSAWEGAPRIVMMLKESLSPDERVLHFVKSNYLSRAYKDKGLVLNFEEDNLSFSLSNKEWNLTSMASTTRQKYNNEIVVKRLKELREQNISFDKLRPTLVEEFGEHNVPGITTLKAWVK